MPIMPALMLTSISAGISIISMKRITMTAAILALLWGFYHSGTCGDYSHTNAIHPPHTQCGFN